MVCRVLLTLAIALFLGLSCESGTRHTAVAIPDVTVVLRPVETSIVEKPELVVEATKTRIASLTTAAGSIHRAQFVNKQKGWVSSNHFVYTTSDEGKTWERLSFKAPDNSRISSFSFADESRGWLTVWKLVHSERWGMGNSSTIFVTKDGGKTWKEQANFPDEVTIKEISFLDAKRGIAIGSQTIDRPVNAGPPYDEFLVLSTDNGGEVWSDISEPVKATLLREHARPGDSGWNVRWLSASEIFLLTRNARVLHSTDSAKTWKSIVAFQDERPNGTISSTAYYKVVFDPERRIRVVGGAMGTEGFWGDLIVNRDNSWTSYELIRVPILDAVFLSANEVLASGMEIPHVDDKTASGPVGVILHSLDSGKSWTPIYRSKSKEMFVSLTRISDKEFYAVSDAGTFLKFELK